MARTFAWIAALVLTIASPCFAAQTTGNHAGAAAPASSAQLYERARAYENGEGVSQDYDRALALYCDAARGGDTDAFLSLGWMFLNGRGVTRDENVAATWLKQAASHGIAQATNLLRLIPHADASPVASGCREPALATQVAVPARIRDLVAKTAREVGIDAQLVTAVIAVESAFNPRAVSPKNAQGLMQLMPATAQRFGVRDPFDEQENVRGGATYLRDLLKQFGGDLTLALAAYNAGEGTIAAHGGVPPYPETKNYIKRVTTLCACAGDEF